MSKGSWSLGWVLWRFLGNKVGMSDDFNGSWVADENTGGALGTGEGLDKDLDTEVRGLGEVRRLWGLGVASWYSAMSQ